MTTPTRPPDAVEQLPIPLFDSVVLAARSPDGMVYLAINDLCATLSLNAIAQRRRIQANEDLHLASLRIFDGTQFRAMDFLLLDDVPTWIITLQTRSLNIAVRDRIRYIKEYLVSAVKAAFAQLTQLPDMSSRAIEDLRDLDRIDRAFQDLAELASRQNTLEDSQDRARIAFRELQTQIREMQSRIQHLEQTAKQRISPTQRGTIYNLVQRWGQAVSQQQQISTGEAIRACWRLFNQRFQLATYTDLPAAYYNDAILFIKEQYHGVTGNDIAAIEQIDLRLE